MAAPAVPTFSAAIADRNIRVFGAAVAFLAKLGKEVTFEGTSEGVSAPQTTSGAGRATRVRAWRGCEGTRVLPRRS